MRDETGYVGPERITSSPQITPMRGHLNDRAFHRSQWSWVFGAEGNLLRCPYGVQIRYNNGRVTITKSARWSAPFQQRQQPHFNPEVNYGKPFPYGPTQVGKYPWPPVITWCNKCTCYTVLKGQRNPAPYQDPKNAFGSTLLNYQQRSKPNGYETSRERQAKNPAISSCVPEASFFL